jgi:hypothetical protein
MDSVATETALTSVDVNTLRQLEGRSMYLCRQRIVYYIPGFPESPVVPKERVHKLLRLGLIHSIDPQQIVLTEAGKRSLGYRDLVSEFFAGREA